jgi:chemotaxis protein CheX
MSSFLVECEPVAKTVDAALVNPFLVSTLECLGVMANLSPVRIRLFLKSTPVMHGDVAGVIGLSHAQGTGVTGSLVVSFPDSLARKVVSGFANELPESLTQDIVIDGIGEVANMVAGGAKRKLAGTRLSFNISTPTLLYGAGTSLHNPPDTVSIASEFKAHPDWPETFLVELATKPVDKS